MTAYDEWATFTTAFFGGSDIANNHKENRKPKKYGTTCRLRSVRLINSKQHDKMAEIAPAKVQRKVITQGGDAKEG